MLSSDVGVSARRLRPPQMLFGVRASQINSYEQQAQTAKRFVTDNCNSFRKKKKERKRKKKLQSSIPRGLHPQKCFQILERKKKNGEEKKRCSLGRFLHMITSLDDFPAKTYLAKLSSNPLDRHSFATARILVIKKERRRREAASHCRYRL